MASDCADAAAAVLRVRGHTRSARWLAARALSVHSCAVTRRGVAGSLFCNRRVSRPCEQTVAGAWAR